MISFMAPKSKYSCLLTTCSSPRSIIGWYWTCSSYSLYGESSRIIVAVYDHIELVWREMLHRQPCLTCALITQCASLLASILCLLYWAPNHQTWLAVIVLLKCVVCQWYYLLTVFDFLKPTMNLISLHSIGTF